MGRGCELSRGEEQRCALAWASGERGDVSVFVRVSVCLCFTPPWGQNPPRIGDLEATPCLLPPLQATAGSLPSPCPSLELDLREQLHSSPCPGPRSVPSSLPVCVGGRVTLQVSRRVQIFLVSGFITPHCLLRSHSFPVGRAVPVSLKGISKGGLRRQKASWASGKEPPGPQCKTAASGETSPAPAALCCPRPLPSPSAAQALLLGPPSPKQGNTHQNTQAAIDIWGARDPAVGGAWCRV